jgi:DNA-binding response OmpR family regulator
MREHPPPSFLERLYRHVVDHPVEPARAHRRRRVLLVDDEPSLCKQAADHLTKLGFEVATVTNGDDALSSLRARRPDLLCLSLNLPRASGYEICEQIRNDPELKDLVVLMTSERVSLEVRAYSFEAGADAYLNKPYTLDELAAEVKRLLSRAPTGRRYL